MEVQIIPDIFFNRVAESGTDTAVMFKDQGTWRSKCWNELRDDVLKVAGRCVDWIDLGDNVCILSENRPEWWIADLSMISLGAVTVPIYATNPSKDIAYILNDCEARLLFISTSEQLSKIEELRSLGQIPKLERVVVFDHVKCDEEWVLPFSTLVDSKSESDDPTTSRRAVITPDDLATLIYTSGTTGEPKVVLLTHRNLVSNVLGAHVVVDGMGDEEKVMLSFLPLSHIFERTIGYYLAIHYGFKVAFAEDVQKLVENMGEVRPTMLASVPRIYEKLYAVVMASAQTGVKKKLVNWSLKVGKIHGEYRMADKDPPLWLSLKYSLATKLVFSKLHAKLGGRLQFAISAGAPLAKEIAEFLVATGLTVFEGYGLTETSPVLTANRPGKMRIGSVGVLWPDVELKIEPEPGRVGEGEILAKGPGIMKGYYKKPDATAEVFDTNEWFKTGDIGFLDADGFLYITDRKKELIKTAGGKYVAPQPIESQLKVHGLIEQAVVIGDRRKYCVVLIVPAFDFLENALGKALPTDRSALVEDPQVRSLYQAAIDEVNRDRGTWEQIKRFYLLSAEMTQESGELTPTLKVKRRVVDERYKTIIDGLYPSE